MFCAEYKDVLEFTDVVVTDHNHQDDGDRKLKTQVKMPKQVPLYTAAHTLSELVREVQSTGQVIVITRHGSPVAALTAVEVETSAHEPGKPEKSPKSRKTGQKGR